VFQEALKTAPPVERDGAPLSENSYNMVAGLANVFLFPGRIITCTLGTGVSVGVLALTFGTGYRAAAAAVEEGCGGKWAVTGADLMPDGGPSRGPPKPPGRSERPGKPVALLEYGNRLLPRCRVRGWSERGATDGRDFSS
jgi:hypothetical protein